MRFSWSIPLAVLAGTLFLPAIPIAHADEGLLLFERKIRPVLLEHCFSCHSATADRLEGGLRLDTREGVLSGGESGQALTPGKAKESLLFDAVSYSGLASEMPPTGKLPVRVIADFQQWIDLGAPLPESYGAGVKPSDKPEETAARIDERRDFWSFLPAVRQPLPPVNDRSWPRRRIDWFILGKLEAQQMRPAGEANPRTLIRRVYFDLHGLPPTAEQVDAFAADKSPRAYERLIDDLLASPRYGERWGRHWLDVARYAEDNPTNESTCKPPRFPHHYRDWVIAALNDDLPYDEFVRRQLAADLMDDLLQRDPGQIAATGLLGLSPVYHKEPKLSKDVISVIAADEWDERIDTISRGLLGLTVACARCHDHKFDPITMRDYYALAGVMASTQLVEWPMTETSSETAEQLTEVQRQLVDYNLRLSYAKNMVATAKLEERDPQPYIERQAALQKIVDELESKPLFDGPIANGVRDAAMWVNGDDPAWTAIDVEPGAGRDLPVFLRGSVTSPGPIAPRRFLEVLSPRDAEVFGEGSGRLELADRIVGDAGSLAARVIVNRVWGWHFGQGLVGTPSNFGELGDRPSHPALLDDLTVRFIEHGWSLKWLHRELLLSAAYRQSSEGAMNDYYTRDPENRLLWRMNRRRLEAEAIRDAFLAVAGELDAAMGGPSDSLDNDDNRRRTVYGAVSRQKPADVLRLFDFPDAKRHVDRRMPTTTPLQQLYLLNSPLLQQQARAVAQRASADETDADETGADGTSADAPRRVSAVFRAILQREPTASELAAALQLVGVGDEDSTEPTPNLDDWSLLAHGLLASNEFLFID
ncbi:MAG: PSD1 and planctomycete cytochrome C domain-containing protein [Pirellulaceae bacterium]